MAGQLKIPAEQLAEFKEAAVKYRQELLTIPVIGLKDQVQYMTVRPGIQGKEKVGTMTGDAQFAPYNPQRSTDFDLNVSYRTLETYFGSVVAKFEPNSAVSTILGSMITKGDGQAQAPTAKDVLTLIAKGLSKNLAEAIWRGVRNETGTTSLDLFDGFMTILQAEKTAGRLSEADGNLLKYPGFRDDDAVEVAKKALRALDPILRNSGELYMFCSQEFADSYDESYLLTHGATPYNQQYEQTAVEGSHGRLKIVPIPFLTMADGLLITSKDNMLVGCDTLSNAESIEVERFEPFVLSYIATIFFGVQLESLDKTRMLYVSPEDAKPEGPPEPTEP